MSDIETELAEKDRAKETILSGFHAFVAQDIDEEEFKQYIDMALNRLLRKVSK